MYLNLWKIIDVSKIWEKAAIYNRALTDRLSCFLYSRQNSPILKKHESQWSHLFLVFSFAQKNSLKRPTWTDMSGSIPVRNPLNAESALKGSGVRTSARNTSCPAPRYSMTKTILQVEPITHFFMLTFSLSLMSSNWIKRLHAVLFFCYFESLRGVNTPLRLTLLPFLKWI